MQFYHFIFILFACFINIIYLQSWIIGSSTWLLLMSLMTWKKQKYAPRSTRLISRFDVNFYVYNNCSEEHQANIIQMDMKDFGSGRSVSSGALNETTIRSGNSVTLTASISKVIQSIDISFLIVAQMIKMSCYDFIS